MKCLYCGREMSSAVSRENPFCSQCLAERISQSPAAPENEKPVIDGKYVHFSDGKSSPVETVECEHINFLANVEVNRLLKSEDSEKVRCYQADVTIKCADCGLPFRFIGLPAGLDLNGAATSLDATEARLAIAPKGQVVTILDDDGPTGFSVRRVK